MRFAGMFILFGLFFVSRLLGVFFFAPHNDEVIFIDFAQTIAGDWSLRFMTLDGSIGDEYKLPLHFWLTAAALPLCGDPLLAARLVLLCFTGAGFVCTWLFFTRLTDRLTGDLTALFIVFSGYHLYFDSVAVTEGILYGTGAMYLYFLYLSMTATAKKVRALAFASATLALFLSICSKESGLLWIPPALVLAVYGQGPGHSASARDRLFFPGTALATVALALLFRYVLVTRGFDEIRSSSIQINMMRNMSELLTLPLGAWTENLRFYFFETLAQSLAILFPPAVLLVAWSLLRAFRADCAERSRALILVLLFALSFLPVVLLAKTQFIRIFGAGLYFACALAAFVTGRFLKQSVFEKKIWRRSLLAVALFFLFAWHIVFTIRPLLQDGQTRLALRETPDPRANGAGIMELIEQIETLPPGFLFYDPRWGHPGTAIKVFGARYDRMEIAPALPPVLMNLESLRPALRTTDRPLYFVFSIGGGPGFQPAFLRVVNDREFCSEKKIFEKRFQKTVLPEQLILCRAGVAHPR